MFLEYFIHNILKYFKENVARLFHMKRSERIEENISRILIEH